MGPRRSRCDGEGLGLKPRFLADKSAYTADAQAGRRTLANLIATRQVATCGVVELEIMYSARGRRDYEAIFEERQRAFERVPIDQALVDRAMAVQRALAAVGRHRAAGVADLLVAAAAERSGLTLLHCDHDFEQIAGVTGQPMRIIARPTAERREAPHVVLAAREGCFVPIAVVDAISPTRAIETAVNDGRLGEDEEAVAVPQRHWQVRAAREVS